MGTKDTGSPLRIGLNLLHALPEIGGGWNYIANLVNALAEGDTDNRYVAFVTKTSECLVPRRSNFETVMVNLRAESRPARILYENTVLQLLVRQKELDCLHWFSSNQAVLNSVPGVVTVYDLLAFLDSASFPVFKRTYVRVMQSMTIRQASLLLPISQATADALHEKLGAEPSRMVVIPVMLKDDFRPTPAAEVEAFRLKYRLPQDFWLYVAQSYPHKNHLRLLRAYHGLKTEGFSVWPLVLRSDLQQGRDEILRTIDELNLQSDIIFLPRLTDQEMPCLYSCASGIIFPSLYEGCGIPVVEAMACGCPVAASSIPAVEEFAGDAAIYFDPTDLEGIKGAMRRLQIDRQLCEEVRGLGLRRAEQFRAAPIVQKLVAGYRRAARR